MYKPNPLDTSKVSLPEDLVALTEQIAANVHDNWALGRINDGWVYGRERNDQKKTSPCLVPYEELSDSERAYDRTTAMETIKMILMLGYTIEKKDEE